MPNRVIREAILDSEAYHALSIDARCLFFELLLNADDYGLVPVGDLYLKRHCPSCEGKSLQAIAGFLDQIATQQMIVIYRNEAGNRFAAIPKFGNSPRSVKPKWPLPPEPLLSRIKELHEKRIASAMHLRSTRIASAPVTVTETVTVTEKKKRKTGRSRARSPVTASPFPADFQLTEPMFSSGLKLGLSREEIARAFIRFCDNAQAKGHEYKDWPAAFRTWCGYDAERKRKEDPPLDLTEGGRYIVE
jgi:hypothetical protein